MIKKIKNKKGSHVGVVVSFVVFVTFLVFLYIIIQPITVREKDKSYILDYITLNLMENSTGNTTTMTIFIEDSVPKECIKIQSIVADIPDNEDLLFKNNEGDTLTYAISGGGFLVEVGTDFDGLLKIFYSDALGNSLGNPSCTGSTPITGVEPTLVRTFSEIFETKMYELNETYYANYDGLKVELGVPEGTEFNFYIYDSQRSKPPIIKAEIQLPPTDRSVFVEETPIQYIDENGNTLFGFLVVKVW